MKMQTKSLIEKLKRLNGIPSKSKTDIAFSGILLERATIMASNSLYAMRLKTEEAIESPIIIPIPAVDLIVNLPNSEVDLAVDGSNLTVASGKIRASFATRPAEEYPRIRTFEGAASITVDWPKFRDSLARVVFACSKNHVNAALHGVHVYTNGNGLNVTACDSFRLAWDYVKTDSDAEIDVVISAEAVTKLINVFDGDTLSISLNKAYAKFEDEAAEFNVRLIDAPYLDVNRIIPTYTNVCTISTDLFNAMLHRTAPLCPTLALSINGPIVDISGSLEGGMGTINDEIELSSRLNTPINISFNTAYLRDAFKAISDDTVEIGFDEGASARLKPMILKSGSVLMLVVPLRA